MNITDPIADFLTRVRNAIRARHKRVEIPSSKMKVTLASILKEQGFIYDFQVEEDNKQNVIRIVLKYTNGVSAISGLKRISKPGLRLYCGSDEVPRVLNGLGVAVISTSKGLKTDKQARTEKLGGEIVCHVW